LAILDETEGVLAMETAIKSQLGHNDHLSIEVVFIHNNIERCHLILTVSKELLDNRLINQIVMIVVVIMDVIFE
jgi:hypothetical protein